MYPAVVDVLPLAVMMDGLVALGDDDDMVCFLMWRK